MVNVNWPTDVAGEADNVSSLSASACHIGGQIDVTPGKLTFSMVNVYKALNVPVKHIFFHLWAEMSKNT